MASILRLMPVILGIIIVTGILLSGEVELGLYTTELAMFVTGLTIVYAIELLKPKFLHRSIRFRWPDLFPIEQVDFHLPKTLTIGDRLLIPVLLGASGYYLVIGFGILADFYNAIAGGRIVPMNTQNVSTLIIAGAVLSLAGIQIVFAIKKAKFFRRIRRGY